MAEWDPDSPEYTGSPPAPEPPAGEAQSNGAAGERPSRSRPTRPLPTSRIAFPKQLELIRAYVIRHEQTGGGATNEDVGNIVGLTASTASLANSFFTALGFIRRADAGYIPSKEAIEYHQAANWQ